MKKRGFTIIELVTVISIIALLIGIMVPGIRAVVKQARELRQKAQFKMLSEGLEAWCSNNDNQYPDSNREPPAPGQKGFTYGAHKLCEALVGRDLMGFDPQSSWNASHDERKDNIYNPNESFETGERVSRYLDLDRIDTVQLGQLYEGFPWLTGGSSDLPYPGNLLPNGTASGEGKWKPCYVFADSFRRAKYILNGRTIITGTPILYYKADDRRKIWNHDSIQSQQIFQYYDNTGIIELPKVDDLNVRHPFDVDNKDTGGPSNPDTFYEALTNPRAPSSEPYNRNSFILLSAGYDGLYGTKDDIWNF